MGNSPYYTRKMARQWYEKNTQNYHCLDLCVCVSADCTCEIGARFLCVVCTQQSDNESPNKLSINDKCEDDLSYTLLRISLVGPEFFCFFIQHCFLRFNSDTEPRRMLRSNQGMWRLCIDSPSHYYWELLA
jgi:hypothetical protein